jgi:CubicO group peptidase (beta-lactamase class C family)
MNDSPIIVDAMPYDELSPENILEIVKTKALKFEPGSKYSYCNTNYLILGMIVEQVSGLSYEEYLTRNIFEVVGMNNTGVYDIENPPENMATGHKGADNPVYFFTQDGEADPVAANATAAAYGAGSLYSTVGDLYLWDQALETDALLSEEYRELLFAPAVEVVGALIPSEYAFGWIIQTDPDFGTIIEHTGALGGFRAFNAMFTEHDITVIILYNNMSFSGRDNLIPALKEARAAL